MVFDGKKTTLLLASLGILAVFISLFLLSKDIEIKNYEATPKSIRIIFVGDVMLDRGVARHATREGFKSLVSDEIRELFKKSDLRIGNLEGTITTNESVALVDPTVLKFTFSPDLAENLLKDLNFTALSSANNHGLDFDESGLIETKENLKKWGIETFGSPLNNDDDWFGIEVYEKKICFVGYHDLFTHNSEKIVGLLEKIEPECWRSVVVPHWGNEYESVHTERQRQLAEDFIDAGADLIVGAHPHVVQPLETYRGVPVFYSLGNFIFDQDFSWATQHGVALVVDFEDDYTKVKPIALSSLNTETKISENEDIKKVFSILTVYENPKSEDDWWVIGRNR